MWVWDQSSGTLSHNGVKIATGYSGNQLGKNNPEMESAKGIGPIPRGMWNIMDMYNSIHTGPHTLMLSPWDGTDTCGRSEFRIHGDSINNPGTASHGCIILPRAIRDIIWSSKDRLLSVVE